MFTPKKKICEHCNEIATPTMYIKGHIAIEIIVWLLFFPAGLVYTIYRFNSKKHICGICKSDRVYDLDSPYGKKLINNINDGQSK